MGFGISVNGSHAAEHNPRVLAAVEVLMDELEKIDDVHANLNGFVDGPNGREHFQRSLPRDKENQVKLHKEQEAQKSFDGKETARLHHEGVQTGNGITRREQGLPVRQFTLHGDGAIPSDERMLVGASGQLNEGERMEDSDRPDGRSGRKPAPKSKAAKSRAAKNDASKLGPGEKWDATDAATKQARKKGVEISGVKGTGAGGTVTVADVDDAAAEDAKE